MPCVMIVLSSATTGRPSASALATGSAMSMKGRAASGVMARCLMPPLAVPAQGPALRQARAPICRPRPSGWRSVSTAAAMPSRSAALSGLPCIIAAIVTPASASPAPVASAIDCRAGGMIEKLPSGSKPVTAALPAGDDAAGEAKRPQPLGEFDRAGLLGRRRQGGGLAAVHEEAGDAGQHAGKPHRLGRRDRDGEQRLAVGERRQPLERGGRQIGVAQDRVGGGDLVARLRAAELLCEHGLVKLHVGQPGDHVAVAVDQRRVARRRAVEENGGEVADLCLEQSRGRRSRRPNRRRAPTSASSRCRAARRCAAR